MINLIASLINVANLVRSSRSEGFGRSQDWAAYEPLNVFGDFDQELDLSSLRPDLQYFNDVRYMTSNRIFVGPTLKNVWEEDSCYTSWHKSEFNQKWSETMWQRCILTYRRSPRCRTRPFEFIYLGFIKHSTWPRKRIKGMSPAQFPFSHHIFFFYRRVFNGQFQCYYLESL